MAHSLHTLKNYTVPSMAVVPKLRELLLQHVEYLRKHPETKIMDVDPNKRSLDLYDLYRFLNNIGYPSELHFVVMLVNDIPSHIDFDTSVDQLIVPKASVVETIISTSMSG